MSHWLLPTGSVLGQLLTTSFQGPPIMAKTDEQMRWDDDGGPPFPDGWDHIIIQGHPGYLTIEAYR